ncbi:MAG TPA: homocysteine S-methyltransferase [Gammaproteobacteria bacterium]|nr:homocysteine S-methyltransferase [Gammaproteobacteria bacterium]
MNSLAHNSIPNPEIAAVLDSGHPFLLDGGLGSELAARGLDIDSPLWSAEMILHNSDALREVHRDYLDAGAMCISTASYQASLPGLAARGMTANESERVFRASVEIAAGARDEFMHRHPEQARPLIAASIGPYGAYLADGSEYRGNYGVGEAALEEFHVRRLAWLDAAGADLLACETIPDLQEARILGRLLEPVSTPVWISFCCRDSATLHDGNSLESAAEMFASHPRVFALGVNCCAPGIVEEAIGRIRAVAPHKLIVVYPNSGQQYDAEARQWSGDAELSHWSSLAQRWFDAGAGLIGGCCRIGPRHIRELAARKSWHC